MIPEFETKYAKRFVLWFVETRTCPRGHRYVVDPNRPVEDVPDIPPMWRALQGALDRDRDVDCPECNEAVAAGWQHLCRA